MLGWEFFVTRERDDATLATWLVGFSGLDWVETFEKKGLATCIEQGGYPTRYRMKAKDVLPVLLRREVPPHDSPEVLGDDYYLPANFSRNFTLHAEAIATCAPDDDIVLEAWDQS